MADQTIGLTSVGAYEIPIAAGATVTFDIADIDTAVLQPVIVACHSGGVAVYAKNGTTALAKDSTTTQIPVGAYSTVPAVNVAGTVSIAVTSEQAAVVSVYRS